WIRVVTSHYVTLCGDFECVPEHGAQDWFICPSQLGRGGG
ncbi:hypothetical protein, partial [Escherichia phage 19-1-2]